jgi:hypothetical protein
MLFGQLVPLRQMAGCEIIAASTSDDHSLQSDFSKQLSGGAGRSQLQAQKQRRLHKVPENSCTPKKDLSY